MIKINFPCEEIKSIDALGSFIAAQNNDLTIEFSEGTYYGSLSFDSLKCKRLQLIGNGTVYLSGATKEKYFFKRHNDKLIVTTLQKGLSFERLKANGQQLILARFPNFKSGEVLNGCASRSDAQKALKNSKNLDSAVIRALHEHEWGGNSYRIKSLSEKGFDLEWIGDNNRGNTIRKDCVVVENAFELLDSENEWYYNKATGELFLFDDSKDSQKELDIEIIDKINLLSVENCHDTNITIENINFIDTERSMFKMPWTRYLRSDWAFNFGSAITIKNSKNINLLNCNFNNLGSTAIGIYDYAENIKIDNCDFTNSNSNGILILGNPDSTYCTSSWDKDNHVTNLESPDKTGFASNNYPRDINISNCYFYNLGIEDKQSAGICVSLSHKITISNSTLHYLPRSGINICENAFGGHLISGCDIFDCVRETGDHGPFNSWGRDRFWSLGGFDTSGKRGNEKRAYALYDMVDKNIIRHNRIEGSRGFGIDLDDGSSNYLIEDNFCFNKGIKIREGFLRTVRNNIIINAPLDIHATYNQSDDEIYNNIILCAKPLSVAILNKGYNTKIFDNYFVNVNQKEKNQKLLKNQKNFFVSGNAEQILSGNSSYEKFKPFDFEFGKKGKPTPNLSKLSDLGNSEKIRNMFGEFSSLDESNRSMSGAKSFDGIYVDKLSLFSPLKKLGVNKNDVIISVNGNNIKGTQVDWRELKKNDCILQVIRQQQTMTIMKDNQIESILREMKNQAYDIIVVAGQSNAYGYGKGKSTFCPSDKIMMFHYDAAWKNQKLKSQNIYLNKAKPWENGNTSFCLYFAEEYIKNDLNNDRKLLILQVAVGGTGFSDHRWGEGENLYETALKFIKLTLSQNSENKIVGFLWHQGETDAGNKVSEKTYFDKLKTLINGFRKAAGNELLPFITGDMVRQWKDENPSSKEIENANKKLEKQLENIKFVDTANLTGNDRPDHIHFSTEDNVELGKRYYKSFKEVLNQN